MKFPEMCLPSRVVERNGLRFSVWTCTSPTSGTASEGASPKVHRRGTEGLTFGAWPGCHDAWSCDTSKGPGQMVLKLFLGGPEEANKTEVAIKAHAAQMRQQHTLLERRLRRVTKTVSFEAVLARSTGKKSFVVKLGRLRRRIFYVSPPETERDQRAFSKAGWYVTAVRSPDPSFNYDPIGPFGSVKELLEIAGSAFREEEA